MENVNEKHSLSWVVFNVEDISVNSFRHEASGNNKAENSFSHTESGNPVRRVCKGTREKARGQRRTMQKSLAGLPTPFGGAPDWRPSDTKSFRFSLANSLFTTSRRYNRRTTLLQGGFVLASTRGVSLAAKPPLPRTSVPFGLYWFLRAPEMALFSLYFPLLLLLHSTQ